MTVDRQANLKNGKNGKKVTEDKVDIKQKPKEDGELKLNVKTPSKDGKVKVDVKASDAPVKQKGAPDAVDMNKGKESDPSLSKDNIDKAKARA